MKTAEIDYFALLKVPVACQVDMAVLEQNYRDLQNRWHPDRFAGAQQSERMVAIQQTSLLNDAFTTLKSPVSRAAHLLALQGIDVSSHTQAHLDQDFLLMQMQLRDELESAVASDSVAALETLASQVAQQQDSLWHTFSELVSAHNWEQAQRLYYQLQFIVKLRDEIRSAEDRLLGY